MDFYADICYNRIITALCAKEKTMATERLFGNEISPACQYCANGFARSEGEQVLCMKRGVVPPDYSCRKFRYDPLLRVPPRPLPLEKYETADFEL